MSYRTVRRAYCGAPLPQTLLDDDPLEVATRWLAEAEAAGTADYNAMCLASASGEGRLSARMVLLRGLDTRGCVFYTSYASRKAGDLEANPHAAAVLYWPHLDRQLRIEGAVERVSDAESDAYFATRPRGHQLSAWASEQSEAIASRELLEQRVKDYAQRFEGVDVPRPHSWGGYVLRPERIEFWQGREDRLHDRIEFRKEGANWRAQRLSP